MHRPCQQYAHQSQAALTVHHTTAYSSLAEERSHAWNPGQIRPAPCSEYGDSFTRKAVLELHFRNRTGAARIYCAGSSCRFGTKGFSRRDKYLDHLKQGQNITRAQQVEVLMMERNYLLYFHLTNLSRVVAIARYVSMSKLGNNKVTLSSMH
jgi:hypothetical protein